MYKHALRLITFLTMLVSAFGAYVPGGAASQTALTNGDIINIAYFFKPPNMDATTAVKHFKTIVLTNGDHVYRDQLTAAGFTSSIPQYFRSEAIYDPGSCTATPLNNTVAYNAGDFCRISQNHPDWFLLDRNGRRITVTSGGKYYRMDPDNAGWRNFFLTRVLASQEQLGWNALFLDDVEGGFGKFFDGKPAKYPDELSYQNAVQGFLQYLYVNYSQKYGRPVYGNIVARASDPVWFNYLQYLDGAMQERFAVDWNETSYVSAYQWAKDMSMMEQTQANGKYVILVAPGYQNDLNRENFAFASYLLISHGKAAFRYSTDDAYRDVWLYDNYKVNLGSPLNSRYTVGSIWRRDFTNGYVAVDPNNHTALIAVVPPDSDTRITIGNMVVGGYTISSNHMVEASYLGESDGPVKVVNTSNHNILASQRIIYNGVSYSETIGMPKEQLTNTYLFPYYNNVAMNSQLRVSNLGDTSTTIKVYLGTQQIDSYTLAGGASSRKNYDGKNGGPLRVTSSNTNILTSVRILFGISSYSELTGYPDNQLTNKYLFPYYNNVAMNSQLRVSNLGNGPTTIKVYLGTQQIDSYTLEAGAASRKNYTDKNGGPLQVTSSATNILTTIRVLLNGNSYSELIGYPVNQVEKEYWYPVYDNVDLNSQLRVSNVGTGSTTITVYAGGAKIDSYPLAAGAATRKNYSKHTGPLHIVSSNAPILTTIRMLYNTPGFSSYYEMTGLPNSQLSTQYSFSWYNSIAMNSQMRFAMP